MGNVVFFSTVGTQTLDIVTELTTDYVSPIISYTVITKSYFKDTKQAQWKRELNPIKGARRGKRNRD